MNGLRFGAAVAFLAVLSTSTVAAQSRTPSPLDALAWMSGSWSGTQGDVTAEEHWTTPSGGLMLCVHRDLRGGRAVSFEFLRIVARGDTITFIAMPRGRNETPFPMKELGPKRVVFENPEHDYPQRILYWQEKPGELKAHTEGTIRGKLEFEEWTWKRSKLAP